MDVANPPAGPPPVTHSLVTALRAVPVFATLDDRALLRIVGVSSNLVFSPGAFVFRKGEPAEALYVILSGMVRIFDEHDGSETDVSRLGPRESFGELSLLLRTDHTKHAIAVEETELMVIPEESFEELLATNPDLDAFFRSRLEERRPIAGESPGTV
jgi:CRP-like cAMP-binding protein